MDNETIYFISLSLDTSLYSVHPVSIRTLNEDFYNMETHGQKEPVSLKTFSDVILQLVSWLGASKPNERAYREVQPSYKKVLIP